MDLVKQARELLDGVTPKPWQMNTLRTSCGVCHKIGPWPHKWRDSLVQRPEDV